MKKTVVDARKGIIREVTLTPAEEAAFNASREVLPADPPKNAISADALAQILIAKGIITDDDVAAARRNSS